ncbi:group-specific phage-like fragment [Bacillus cereus E33L]|uniref:Group-specific phage-like n=1 Tax=Bacillus cereus (strain ZK / E33L) TaxID=288681 RepID=Q63C17_BACCZ|nr:group-specific phage-like fragment [Bacillus cereus E33L]
MGVILVGIRKENLVEMTAEIDLKINGIYIVKNGQVQLIEPPKSRFGEQSFVYQSGKVIQIEERKTRLI